MSWRIVTNIRTSALHPPRANVPAKRTQQTNALAATWGDKTRGRCGLLPDYFEHLFEMRLSLS